MAKYKYKVVDINGGSFSVPKNSSFYIDYIKGTTVKALKESLGIMVYPNFKAAEHFLSTTCCGMSRGRIKRVIPIGRKTVPKWVSKWTISDKKLKAFNKMVLPECPNAFYCSRAPLGTECYPKVIVVD